MGTWHIGGEEHPNPAPNRDADKRLMTSSKYPILITVLIWAVCVAAYAFYYVKSHLTLPALEGYEAAWSWQLLFFGLTRLPWLLAGLAGVVLLERRLFKSG